MLFQLSKRGIFQILMFQHMFLFFFLFVCFFWICFWRQCSCEWYGKVRNILTSNFIIDLNVHHLFRLTFQLCLPITLSFGKPLPFLQYSFFYNSETYPITFFSLKINCNFSQNFIFKSFISSSVLIINHLLMWTFWQTIIRF